MKCHNIDYHYGFSILFYFGWPFSHNLVFLGLGPLLPNYWVEHWQWAWNWRMDVNSGGLVISASGYQPEIGGFEPDSARFPLLDP